MAAGKKQDLSQVEACPENLSEKADLLNQPSLEQLQKEFGREQKRHRRRVTVFSTIFFLTVVAATVILLIVFALPVLQIEGTSMSPGLQDGDVILSVTGMQVEVGDIVAFYHNNTIFIKRVIAVGGDWVNIASDGEVSVNGTALEEPYVTKKSRGKCDIDLPFQVPGGQYFVMGDNRSTSVDSRSTSVGCVSEDMLIGRLTLRLWPFDRFGLIENMESIGK